MNNQAYFTASSMQTMQGFLLQLGVRVDYSKHKEANVLILLSTGVYLLASVNALERSCKTYLSDWDEIVTTDVVQLFNVCQNSACWVELVGHYLVSDIPIKG